MTAVEFNPRPYQDMIVKHILTTPRCAVWAGMGMGKTSATLTAIECLLLCSNDPILVLAPLRVAQTTWPDEVEKWAHTKSIVAIPVTGNLSDRMYAVRQYADVHTTNYENLPWLVEHWGDRWPYRTVISDESTRLKSFRLRQGGKRAQALGKVAHCKVDRFVELTGTACPNGLEDLWGQMWFIDQGKRLGKTFSGFRDRWFRKHHSGFGYVPLPHAQGEIQTLLHDVCLTVEAKDWFDLREPIVTNIHVRLPAAARKTYDEMEKQMFAQLSCGNEIEAVNAAARTIKCLQIASGAAYVGEDNTAYTEVHDLKIQALGEIIEEAAGMPILCAYHFKSDLKRILKAFPQARELTKDPKVLKAWNAGEIPLLLAHPQSAGHGLNLQDGGNILVYFGHWWALEERLQIAERIGPTRQLQAGYDRPVYIYNIIATDTVDEMVLERVETKREVQDILLAAMKRKGIK